MKRVLIVFVMTLAFVTGAQAANAPSNSTEGPDLSKATEASAAKVKYKAGKEMNFEELIIQGQLKRPEMSVVTGDPRGNGFGLLRMRENFIDHTSAELGENIQ